MLSLRDSLRSSTHKGRIVPGWPICLGETLLLWKSKDKKCCLNKTPYIAAPIWVSGDVIAKSYALRVTSYRCISEKTRLVILRLLCEISTRRSTSKSGAGKDYLLHYLRSPAKSTFKCLCKQTLLWHVIMRKTPQEPWRSRWLWERDSEQSAPTHTHHTHCASRQLGTIANQRYDVLWDWLWDACQMARVRWGTRYKGFCSKEGPHYQVERIARNQLERNQVQRAFGKLSRSCHQTSNNQPWFTTLEIPWGFLAWAVLHWFSGGLCHARKCQFKEFCVRRKGMICKLPMDICKRSLRWKAEQEIGTKSCTRFPRASCFKKTRHVCQKYGGAYRTWYSEYQRYKKWDKKLDSCAAEKGAKKLVSSNCAKILEKEISN